MSVGSEEDLEDYWRDLLPGRWYQYSLDDALRSGPTCLSFGLAADKRAEVYDRASKLSSPGKQLFVHVRDWLPESTQILLKHALLRYAPNEATNEGAGKVFVRDLLHASRAASSIRLKALERCAPMARYLEVVHGVDADESLVVKTLWNWVTGFERSGWGLEERDLLGLSEDELALETEAAVRSPSALQTRLLHLLLLGGVYGLYERAVLVADNLDDLLRTPFLTSRARLLRARQVDTLLEEIDRWKERFATHVTVILGWSGHAEDAVLLRGLHEPLMRKLDASKFWLP